MAGTKTKKPAAKPVKKAEEPAPKAYTLMPADWTARPEHATYALAKRLRLADISYGSEDELAEWIANALKPDEVDAIARYVAAIEWLDFDEERNAVYASQLVVPDALAPRAADWTREIADVIGAKRILPDPEKSIAEVEAAAAEPIANAAAEPTPAPTVEANGQIALVQEPAKPKTLKPMEFLAGDEVASVRLSLIARADDLDAEAKRLNTLGKSAEAASVQREAKNIRERLLPQVTSQQAIAFNAAETLPGAIARVFQGELRARARRQLVKSVGPKKGESKQDAEQRALGKLDDLEQLIGNIGEQAGTIVYKILVEAADRGNQYGLRGMQATPDVIARDAIHAVEQELQQGQAAA